MSHRMGEGWGRWDLLWDGVVADSVEIRHETHMCYFATFGRSMSDGTSVIKEKIDQSRPAFQSHSGSLEPTWIDRLPLASCQ